MSSNNGCDSDTKQINDGGSDTKRHYTGGTAANQYHATPNTPLSTPVTGTLSNGYVGNKPTK
jgi:hypothetical protein